eukprot:CAMPEP_0203919986 /NCGR_PEP_ID=MMETSP0359-20131031/60341_1 /ASSEMBLY_ACC=CAM_ASM_000338 /TAXON_ID=268821 /ORGANISM="Scrippsiella Hangoei, Strain SHTV-5" /LENGTH=32 /DNA_ID= /DNA_START= /DNA_END= /DNA_ORIENTATION=
MSTAAPTARQGQSCADSPTHEESADRKCQERR